MTELVTIEVPDLGDFEEVEVIEIVAQVGEHIEKEQTLLTLESDKASMDVPSPVTGTVEEIHVAIGDHVRAGTTIASVNTASSSTQNEKPPSQPPAEAPSGEDERTSPATADNENLDADVVVLGAGPGGYTAAFRAADLGLNTILVGPPTCPKQRGRDPPTSAIMKSCLNTS